MLEISIPPQEILNNDTYEIIQVPGADLTLEHSLVSLKKWEERWHIPFLKKDPPKTPEQLRDYVKCMTINSKVVNPIIYEYIPKEIMDKIASYIEDPMTATWFGNNKNGQSYNKSIIDNRVITAELIYYWMICLNIPVEFQKWHLNQLITLIRVCSEENKPPEKRNKIEAMQERKMLNEYRKKHYNTKG